MSDILSDYPEVLDKKIYPDAVVSENYYPDWSKAAFMDLRNIKNLLLESIYLKALNKDESKLVIMENCTNLHENVVELL